MLTGRTRLLRRSHRNNSSSGSKQCASGDEFDKTIGPRGRPLYIRAHYNIINIIYNIFELDNNGLNLHVAAENCNIIYIVYIRHRRKWFCSVYAYVVCASSSRGGLCDGDVRAHMWRSSVFCNGPRRAGDNRGFSRRRTMRGAERGQVSNIRNNIRVLFKYANHAAYIFLILSRTKPERGYLLYNIM